MSNIPIVGFFISNEMAQVGKLLFSLGFPLKRYSAKIGRFKGHGKRQFKAIPDFIKNIFFSGVNAVIKWIFI